MQLTPYEHRLVAELCVSFGNTMPPSQEKLQPLFPGYGKAYGLTEIYDQLADVAEWIVLEFRKRLADDEEAPANFWTRFFVDIWHDGTQVPHGGGMFVYDVADVLFGQVLINDTEDLTALQIARAVVDHFMNDTATSDPVVDAVKALLL